MKNRKSDKRCSIFVCELYKPDCVYTPQPSNVHLYILTDKSNRLNEINGGIIWRRIHYMK